MRTVLGALMMLILLSACSSTVSSNDQFTGDELDFKTLLSFSLEIPVKALDKLSPEAIERIYSKFAEGVSELPENSFNSWFQQDQASATELQAEVRAELKAMVAKELAVKEEEMKELMKDKKEEVIVE